MTATAELTSAADRITSTMEACRSRLDVIRRRYDDYVDGNGRRATIDLYHDAARCIFNTCKWLAGDFDRTYAGPHPSFGTTLEDFRVHYADDALRTALHYLVWAEYYSGLRDRDSANEADPSGW
jgi:hypothetical protein